ncbi:hypothetical protein GCM10010358_72400 [Streptomyces minutiscleroticus]|uniref:Uncharacterized protein n=1 Tax=Streptomyces minutiscleroticus TaxID=68238 RepID=A0A918NZ99_9ACTN|nr:hypothetical protein GCM10010358_72400 [Streptomyces minutiscleroticus]
MATDVQDSFDRRLDAFARSRDEGHIGWFCKDSQDVRHDLTADRTDFGCPGQSAAPGQRRLLGTDHALTAHMAGAACPVDATFRSCRASRPTEWAVARRGSPR